MKRWLAVYRDTSVALDIARARWGRRVCCESGTGCRVCMFDLAEVVTAETTLDVALNVLQGYGVHGLPFFSMS